MPTAGRDGRASRRVTVVVPTRDRPASLARCLDALEAQTCESFEVVVVDDRSCDGDAVASVVAGAPHARLLRGEGRGPAAARNLGVGAAEGGIVCFTDDDCRPSPRWIDAIAARLGAGAAVVAGPTINGRPTDAAAAASQVITNHLVEASHDGAGHIAFAPTSNLAARVDVLERAPFDERYPLAAGEDREWCGRLVGAG